MCTTEPMQWSAVSLEDRVLSAVIEDARSRYLGGDSVERRVRSPETEYSWSRDLEEVSIGNRISVLVARCRISRTRSCSCGPARFYTRPAANCRGSTKISVLSDSLLSKIGAERGRERRR